ncbi:MAG: hypothetical protein RLZZ385_1452 [Pseudomonadota bacterium]|jgi:AraC family transcriptional regulator of adaptative response / DNA-3-methyladenine glycosylase II
METRHLLNSDELEQARQTRDPRFDGRFFVGVLTTGIYCRPVCPVRIPRKENVQLYPTAAAAAEAGFRPCLRCRPETSPGTPAWLGSSWKVSRALQLIDRGLVDDGSLDQLAAQLEVGTRQLSRLFKKHIGASPVSVAQTRRLHFAKQLIDDTDLTMTEICFAAGFGSVRRFNALFQSVYGRSPSRLRGSRGRLPRSEAGIALDLRYRPPFDWRSMLDFFALRAIPGVECVGDSSYQRTISRHGKAGVIRVDFHGTDNRVRLQVDFPDTSQLLPIVEQVRCLFDLRADSLEIQGALAQDPLLAPLVECYPGLRVPGCWDGLEVAIRAVLGQQVSVKGASTLMARLVQRLGTPLNGPAEDGQGGPIRVFPSPQHLLDGDYSGLGITGQRIDAIKTLARQVLDGSLLIDGSLETAPFVDAITRIKGIGTWTAQYIALRALNDPDAFPDGDLVLQQVAGWPGPRLSARQLAARSQPWKPWRAYAVMLLWKHAQALRSMT